MKHRSLALCLVLGLVAATTVVRSVVAAPQQEGSVFGLILDGDSGDPLPGTQVYVDGTVISDVTARDGSFVLRDVPAGQLQILFRHACYHPVSVAITMREDSEEDPVLLRFSLPVDHQVQRSCLVQWLAPS